MMTPTVEFNQEDDEFTDDIPAEDMLYVFDKKKTIYELNCVSAWKSGQDPLASKTLTVTNRGLLCWIENRMLNETIIALQKDQIESSQMQSSMVFDIAATAVLDIRYLAYLKKHVHCKQPANNVSKKRSHQMPYERNATMTK